MAFSSLRLAVIFLCVCPLSFVRASTASFVCPQPEPAFFDALRLQCPHWIERSSPLEVNGEILDEEVTSGQRNAYYSVLFYSSWCPFSHEVRSTFEALSMMFPQIRHLTVEESSAMPSVLSRYRIRSFPSILVTNSTMMVRYHGPKDLNSLVHFYKRTTGLDAVAYIAVDKPSNLGKAWSFWPWGTTVKEIITNEPYLTFAFLYICLKALVHIFPKTLLRMKAFWFAYAWHLNVGMLGESNQLLERVLHVIDVKRIWNKLRLCNKSRNFQKGAKNARVWASSLASVSLGEPSSSRLTSPES